MPLALSVGVGYVATNDQKTVRIIGTMTITGTGNYPVGGLPVDAVMLALPESTGSVIRVDASSALGYIWTRVPSTGKLMALQVPATASLTTAAPATQIPSTVDNNTLVNELISFETTIKRNA